MLFCRLLIFFKIKLFEKILSGIPLECQTVLDPDQARQFVGPDLGPKCLPRLSADDTGRQRVNKPMQYTLSFVPIKFTMLREKKCIFFLFLLKAKNIDCGSLIEPSQ